MNFPYGMLWKRSTFGVASKYQELMDNDEQQDMPLIRKLRNGQNKTVKFHRDKMNKIVAQLFKPTPGNIRINYLKEAFWAS